MKNDVSFSVVVKNGIILSALIQGYNDQEPYVNDLCKHLGANNEQVVIDCVYKISKAYENGFSKSKVSDFSSAKGLAATKDNLITFLDDLQTLSCLAYKLVEERNTQIMPDGEHTEIDILRYFK